LGSIGMPEIIVIFIVILMLFGSKRLPGLARGLGKGIRELKKATNELKNELNLDPVKREFEQEIKGNLDEIKNDLDKTIHSGSKEPGGKSYEQKQVKDDSSKSQNVKEKSTQSKH